MTARGFLAPGSLFRWSDDDRVVVKIAGRACDGESLQVHAVFRERASERVFMDHRSYDNNTEDEVLIDSAS